MFSRGLAYVHVIWLLTKDNTVFLFGSLTNTEKRNMYGIYYSLTLQYIPYLFIYLFIIYLIFQWFARTILSATKLRGLPRGFIVR